MNKFIKTFIIVIQMVMMISFTSCKKDIVISYQKNAQGVKFKLDKGFLQVNVISEFIFECRYYLTDSDRFRKSLMVVNKPIDSVNWTIEQKDDSYLIKTGKIVASISTINGLISYFDKEMHPILKENVRSLSPKEIEGENVFNLNQTFGLSPDEAIYGLGQTQKGYMNLRGESLELYQKNKEDYIPVVVSTNGYGILWDNYSYTLFKDNNQGMNLWSEVGDGIDYYFIYGPDMDKVISGYRNLTGGCPMLPKWAFGYVQSKERYKTQDEILNTVKEYRERKIPLDVIVEDWHYWPEGQWGQKSFDPSRFQDPANMIEELHDKYHTKFMISIWGVMTMGFPNANEIVNTKGSNYYRIKPDEIYYDPFNPIASGIYWKQCNEGLFSKGVDAWWCDATEPEIDRVFFISADSVRKKMTTSMGSGARYMCAYPLMHSKNMYENQRKVTSEKRVVNLTRSGFGGQQRFSTIVWSGDIMASWDVFKKQIPAGLNFCATGIPYWTTDIGAFFVAPRGDDGGFDMGTKDDEYKELYLRWFQFGAFCPMFRSHGTDFAREVWRFGDPGTWCYDGLMKMERLRYRILPYIYSLGWMTTHSEYTMMRPLAFDFRLDKNVFNVDDQFMFGPAFMVNPVTETKFHKSPGNAQTIPSSVLFSDGQHGLKGEYFNGLNFGKKIGERRDTVIDFQWQKNPLKGMDFDHFSIRWSGQVLTKDAGDYSFTTSGDDGVRLWLDNKLIIDDWNNHGTEVKNNSINLKANTKYNIKLEFYDNIKDAVIKLAWRVPQKQQLTDTTKASRNVYLPANTQWYDFWTGAIVNGGKSVAAPAPLDHLPLYIKAGSIIPMGPDMQYSTEKSPDPVEIRIYAGANGNFTLYEDENDSYNYEKGLFATIPFSWNDNSGTLTIGKRTGKFPGMLEHHTFNIVFVDTSKGIGEGITINPDKSIDYTGEAIVVNK